VVAPYRVIYGDTDAMGVVYHATYLRFMEMGRTEYLRACGGNYRDVEAAGFWLPVTEVKARYRAPARFDDLLDVATCIEAVHHVTLRFSYRITRQRDGSLILDGSSKHACLDAATGKPTRLPEGLRRAISAV
jgi:acyl-CoA thioester hydrolase